MAKKLKNVCEELWNQIRSELNKFRETVDRELRRELREINASQTVLNTVFEVFKNDRKEAKSEKNKLREENAKLQA